MYGIIVWLSAAAQSALIVTDGGTDLAYGQCSSVPAQAWAVGDLVFALGLRPDQGEFTGGLSLIIPGFWPDVDKAMAATTALPNDPILKTTLALPCGQAPIIAENLPAAPSKCIEKFILTAIK